MGECELFDVIIVGGGPAGLTAGIYAMRAAMKTVLIEKDNLGGQVFISKGIENYPGFINIEGTELSDKFQEHARYYGLQIVRDEVAAIEPGAEHHSVRLSNGKCLKAMAVIVAVGGKARRLRVPGEEEYLGRGVSYCATCDGFFFHDRVVAVQGGGDTALEESLYLSRIAEKVHLIHRRDAFRGSKILQQRVMSQPNIEVILNSIVTRISANEEGVNKIRIRNVVRGDDRNLEVEGLFIFIGFEPETRLIPAGVEMSSEGYVLTDSKRESSIPGLFVVGDIREKYANQIVVAAADGCVAALAAARCVEMKKAGAQACGMMPA